MQQHFADNLEDLIHARSRLAVLSFLAGTGAVDFVKLREEVNLSDGSLSQALKKLEEHKLVRLDRVIDVNRTRTNITLTRKGADAFRDYVEKITAMVGAIEQRNTG